MRITSPAFSDKGSIPALYTCDDADLSPPIAWDDVPNGTESFALIVDDPDAPDPAAPKMVYVHWVLYDMPASTQSLPEGTTTKTLPQGTRAGKNDFGHTNYGGPCPPIGRHRYFHKLYALDTSLGDRGALSKNDLLAAIQGHVLAEAQLVGTYERTRS
jgi:Raf kinase inhibitor-like YbhB/YbcL family protein